jgi:hypothetical protein
VKEILIGTHNRHKAREISELLSDLGITVRTLNDFPGVPETDEDGKTLEENAVKKAREYAQATPKVDFAEIARRHNINPDGSDALLPAIAQALRHPAGNPSKILKDRRSFIAGRRADGGPVDKGKPYLVGERGPEVVIPDQPGTVIPNHAINPNAYPGLSAMPPRPKATTAQPMVRQKVDGKNWKPSARPAAKAVAGNWRLPPPKIAPSLLVAR